jgi:hypothetical protein
MASVSKGAQVAFTSVLPGEINFNKKTLFKSEISQLCRRILSLVIAQSREGAKRGFLSLRAQLLYFHTTVKMEQKLLMVLAAAHSAAKSFPLGVSNVFMCSLSAASFILAVLY